MKIVAVAKKALIIICVLHITASIAGASSYDDKSTDSINAKSNALLIDVRTKKEFSKGHIKGAINIPFHVIAKEIDDVATSRDQSIVLYCIKGLRAWLAKRSLNKKGCNNVINEGGYKKIIKVGKYEKAELLDE